MENEEFVKDLMLHIKELLEQHEISKSMYITFMTEVQIAHGRTLKLTVEEN